MKTSFAHGILNFTQEKIRDSSEFHENVIHFEHKNVLSLLLQHPF